MRFLGADSVKTLPGLVNENTARASTASRSSSTTSGDEPTKLELSKALVALAEKYNSKDWLDAQTKIVKEYNGEEQRQGRRHAGRRAGRQDPRAAAHRRGLPGDEEGRRAAFDRVPRSLRRRREASRPERRKLALAALEGSLDKNNPDDLERIFAIAKNDDAPERGPRRRVPAHRRVPEGADRPEALHALRASRSGRSAGSAVELVLKTMTTKHVPEFMAPPAEDARHEDGHDRASPYGGVIRRWKPRRRAEAARRHPSLPASQGPRPEARPRSAYFWDGQESRRTRYVQPHARTRPAAEVRKRRRMLLAVRRPEGPGPKETEPKELQDRVG